MAFAVSLLFNPDIADVVSRQWQRLAEAGLSRSMLDLGYPPHVTLAVSDHLDTTTAAAALDEVFRRVKQIEATLTGIATFGPDSGVCYVALAPSSELHRLHESVLAVVGENCRPHYRAGRWTPHCTLAMNLPNAELDGARALLAGDWRPLAGVFETADLVEFAPILGIKRWALPSA